MIAGWTAGAARKLLARCQEVGPEEPGAYHAAYAEDSEELGYAEEDSEVEAEEQSETEVEDLKHTRCESV